MLLLVFILNVILLFTEKSEARTMKNDNNNDSLNNFGNFGKKIQSLLSRVENQTSFEKEYGSAELWEFIKQRIIAEGNNEISPEDLDNILLNDYQGNIADFVEENFPNMMRRMRDENVNINNVKNFYK